MAQIILGVAAGSVGVMLAAASRSDQYRHVKRLWVAGDLIDCRGGLLVCENPKTLRALERDLDSFAAHGIEARIVLSEELRRMEPALAPHLAGAVFFPSAARCTDPAEFGSRLAAHALTRGAQIVKERVKRIEPGPGGSWQIFAENTFQARSLVIAAGVWSGEILTALGYNVPIETERGYHLMLPNSGITLNHPMVFQEPHFAATLLSGGLRLAGTVEFAGTTAPMNPRRSDVLYDLAARYLPGIRREGATRWMGFWPSFPDSLPAIGQAQNYENLFYCFGHQHLGLTQAGISAKLIADLFGRRPPRIDLRPFSLTRF